MKNIAEQLAEQAQLAQEKYEGKSINELAYNTYKSLTDDSFPYPEAKAYFIFLTYLYGTMAEKHKLFR